MKRFMILFFAVAAQSAPESAHSAELTDIAVNAPGDISDEFQKTVYEVFPSRRWNLTQDVLRLEEALKKTQDLHVVTRILADRPRDQLEQIAHEYYERGSIPLSSDLNSGLPMEFGTTAVALMTPLPSLYATKLRGTKKFSGVDESAVIDVLAPLSNDEIKATAAAYREITNFNLTDDLIPDTSEDFQVLLEYILAANRSEDPKVDKKAAKYDAKKLFAAGNQTDVFFSILTTRSYSQLRTIFKKFLFMYKIEIFVPIEEKFSGDTRKWLLTLVKVAQDKNAWFAEQLHKTQQNWRAEKKNLIFYIASRYGNDLGAILAAYLEIYERPLAADLEPIIPSDSGILLYRLISQMGPGFYPSENAA